MRSHIRKTAGVLLAAAMLLSSCGDDDTLHPIDSSSAESAAETTTVTTTAATTATTVKKTTTTTKKKTKSNEIQMVPDGFYDITPIISAYKSGDLTSLDPTQDAILEAALEFIEDCDGENMTKAEKELAVHDKMIAEIEYDKDELDPLADHLEESETPYGALINRKAICSGYSLTFNLLTQLLGIESITVEGERSDGSAHSWNQVKLGQDWYCVDVTWDRNHYDEGGLKLKHRYFNCTSDSMRSSSHVWDEPDYPAANGSKYSYMKMKMESDPYYAFGSYDVEQLIQVNTYNGLGELVFIPDPYYLDVSDASFMNTEEMDEIKELFIENDCWFLEAFTEETDNGLAVMFLYRTIKEEERPKEESSSEDESADSDSSSDGSQSQAAEEGSSSEAEPGQDSEPGTDSSENNDESSQTDTEENADQ